MQALYTYSSIFAFILGDANGGDSSKETNISIYGYCRIIANKKYFRIKPCPPTLIKISNGQVFELSLIDNTKHEYPEELRIPKIKDQFVFLTTKVSQV